MSIGLIVLCDRYQDFARGYYRKHGQPTRTSNNIRDALRELRAWAASQPPMEADYFQASHLRLVRRQMETSGRLCVRTINDRVAWIRQMFVWAVQEALLTEEVALSLHLVKPLKPGSGPAPVSEGVKPVSWEIVSSTIAAAPLKLATMIELQWCTGMRSGELVRLAKSRIDRQASPSWLYRPDRHKTQHRGHARIIPLGPVAQNLITLWWSRAGEDWLFPGKLPGKPMRPLSYYRAICRINEREGIPHWHPHQIRHSVGTAVARTSGMEAARDMLGHRTVRSTEIYVEPDAGAASRLAQKFG